MRDLSKKVSRNYIDCEWFIKSNKACFLCFLLCILAGAMEYNSVADIPSMAMVLVLLSFYAHRKEYFRAYGQFVMFMAYYMHLAISLKIFWSMLAHIPGSKPYFEKQDGGSSDGDGALGEFLRMSMLLFGVQEAGEHQKDVSHKSRSLQVFFMLMVLYCVQCWKQQRWTTIRYETAGMPDQENASGYAKLIHSLEERERRKAELHHIEEIRKKEAKQKKDKAKKKRQGSKTVKKSEKKGLISDLRKNLN
jgi:hypothetical protein